MSSGAQPSPKIVKPAETRWAEAYDSDTFRTINKKRFGFVVPALLSFTAMFLVFWIMQSVFPQIARVRVYGYVNVNFIYTMLIFPAVWLLGFAFVRYIRRNVYPLEEELNRRYGKGAENE